MTDTTKPSKAQRKVLRRLADGDRIILNPVTAVFYLVSSSDGFTSSLRRETVLGLMNAKAVSRTTLRITAKGRRAIE